jgi:hypothetical protein
MTKFIHHLRARVAAAVLLGSLSIGVPGKAETLSIEPVEQLTQVWCWLGVGEMVFRHYQIPTVNPFGIYQCGIIGALAHGTAYHACSENCALCTMPAGSWQNVVWMLQEYPKKVRDYLGVQVDDVEAEHLGHALSQSEIVAEIDDGNPVIAGISPSGRPPGNFTSQHVALIVGYGNNGNTLIVNDPYPFPPNVWQNPYMAAGAQNLGYLRYAISYDAFRQSLNWAESFRVKRVAASPAEYPNFCCTQAGRLGPYPNTSIPAGGVCFGTHPIYGPFPGVACY